MHISQLHVHPQMYTLSKAWWHLQCTDFNLLLAQWLIHKSSRQDVLVSLLYINKKDGRVKNITIRQSHL